MGILLSSTPVFGSITTLKAVVRTSVTHNTHQNWNGNGSRDGTGMGMGMNSYALPPIVPRASRFERDVSVASYLEGLDLVL